jgi:hypothetical protein
MSLNIVKIIDEKSTGGNVFCHHFFHIVTLIFLVLVDWQRSKKRGDSIEEDDSSREREEVFETIELDELKSPGGLAKTAKQHSNQSPNSRRKTKKNKTGVSNLYFHATLT